MASEARWKRGPHRSRSAEGHRPENALVPPNFQLGRACKGSAEQTPNHAKLHHREIVDGELLIPRRDAATPLDPADESLDDVAAPVQLLVEVFVDGLIHLRRNHVLYPVVVYPLPYSRHAACPVPCNRTPSA